MSNNDALRKIQSLIDNKDDSSSKILNLFENKEAPFKEQLVLVLSSLPYSQAQDVYKLFQAMPDVREAWVKSLEIRIERQQTEMENLSLQVHTLDKDLNELLERYTALHMDHSDFKTALESIVRKQKEISLSSEDISTDAEAELLEKNQEIIGLAEKALKKE